MNDNQDNQDLYETDNSDLNEKSTMGNRSFKLIAMFSIIAVAIVAATLAGGMAFIKSKLHTQKKEVTTESVRRVTDAPENIGKIPPKPRIIVEEEKKAEEKAQDNKPPEPTETVAVTASNTQPENQPKPPTLTERRLAGGDMQNNPQNATPQAVAVRMVKNMNLTLMKGTKIPCVLENSIISEQDGFTSCIVSHDIYSGNAHTLLIEKGSRITGMYSGSVKNGDSRLQIIWDRIITPFDLAIDLNSPTTDRLGASGVTGKVDNRWGTRIGSALLVSLISDTLNIVADRQKGRKSEVYIESETADTGHDIAEKILDKNINIPPIIYIEEGKTINIYAAQDIDFSSVYRIRKTMFHNQH